MLECRALTIERFVPGVKRTKACIAGIEGHKAQGATNQGTQRELDGRLCFCKRGFACGFACLPELPFESVLLIYRPFIVQALRCSTLQANLCLQKHNRPSISLRVP